VTVKAFVLLQLFINQRILIFFHNLLKNIFNVDNKKSFLRSKSSY